MVAEVQRVELGGTLLNILVYEAKTELEVLFVLLESEVVKEPEVLAVVSCYRSSSEADELGCTWNNKWAQKEKVFGRGCLECVGEG